MVLKTVLVTLIPSSFMSSQRSKVSRLDRTASTTVHAAVLTSGNTTTAPHRTFGFGNVRTVNSVMTPKVPSAPRYSALSSYPVLDLRTGCLVRITAPVGVTTTMDRTFSLLVPYFSVDMPLPPVLAMPPIDGLDDGSGPNKSPRGSRNLFSSFFKTPAPTTASCSP